jgi:Domain of unknown function DUF11
MRAFKALRGVAATGRLRNIRVYGSESGSGAVGQRTRSSGRGTGTRSATIAACAALAAGVLGQTATTATATATLSPDELLQTALPTADLAILSNTANVSHAKAGQEVTFTIVATNNGPSPADTYVSTGVPENAGEVGSGGLSGSEGLELVSVKCDRANNEYCSRYPDLLPGETVTTTVVAKVQPDGSEYASDKACVQGGRTDPDTSNNCATATLRILGNPQCRVVGARGTYGTLQEAVNAASAEAR